MANAPCSSASFATASSSCWDVVRETVDRDDGLEAELLDDPQVRGQVLRSPLERRQASVEVAAVPLQRPGRGDENGGVRRQPTRTADDVDELLEAEIAAEAAFGNDVVRELQADEIGDERAVAVRDVRKGPSVDERRLAFERLHEIGLEGVLEQNGHRARNLELLGRHRVAVIRPGDRDRAEPAPDIVGVAGHRHQRHHLGGGRDVEPRLARERILLSDPDVDAAKKTILDVQAAAPRDIRRVDPEVVAVNQMRGDGGGEKVVGGGDRVQVAGEVQVDVLRRGRPGPGRRRCRRPSRQHGADRRLAQADEGALADEAEPLRSARPLLSSCPRPPSSA